MTIPAMVDSCIHSGTLKSLGRCREKWDVMFLWLATTMADCLCPSNGWNIMAYDGDELENIQIRNGVSYGRLFWQRDAVRGLVWFVVDDEESMSSSFHSTSTTCNNGGLKFLKHEECFNPLLLLLLLLSPNYAIGSYGNNCSVYFSEKRKKSWT